LRHSFSRKTYGFYKKKSTVRDALKIFDHGRTGRPRARVVLVCADVKSFANIAHLFQAGNNFGLWTTIILHSIGNWQIIIII
jgi:hypothetical protein